MSEIFLVALNLNYEGHSMKEFHKLLVKQAEALVASQEMKVLGTWMAVGENNMYLFIEGSGDCVDKFLMSMPLMKELGSQVQSTVTPLLAYESFANNMNAMCKKDKRYEIFASTPTLFNLYYLLDIDIEYHGLTQEALLDVWLQEIETALASKKRNIVVDIWKVVATRKVYVLICVESPAMMDQISFNLPMMKNMGDNMFIKSKRIRKFEALCEDLK